ncbi:MAG: hypothetical protein SYC29_06710 [Planctomycetota bacterium]|nr:hypothetical protein [Planctomycetota bacterium]
MNEQDRTQLSDAMRWALDSAADPSMASADWLAMDIDPSRRSAVALLTDAHVSLSQLRKAKSVYKTMRLVGETAADRRLGARLYTAAIAAALVRHGRRISRQSDAALRRAFRSVMDDESVPQDLREMADKALFVLDEMP